MAPRVVLVGLPGSGKTTVGKRLAQALDLPLQDSDQLIEQLYNGRSCGEVLSTIGEQDFRTVEAQVIADALTGRGVLSLGGGAVVTKETRDRLRKHNVVFLDISVEEGLRRTSRTNSRPLLDVPDPRAKFQQLYDDRRGFYLEIASVAIASDSRDARQVVDDIIHYLQS